MYLPICSPVFATNYLPYSDKYVGYTLQNKYFMGTLALASVLTYVYSDEIFGNNDEDQGYDN